MIMYIHIYIYYTYIYIYIYFSDEYHIYIYIYIYIYMLNKIDEITIKEETTREEKIHNQVNSTLKFILPFSNSGAVLKTYVLFRD